MCKYCDKLYSGDLPEWIFDDALKFNEEPVLWHSCIINDEDEKRVLNDSEGPFLVVKIEAGPAGTTSIMHRTIPISYCPFCGRNIKGGRKNGKEEQI